MKDVLYGENLSLLRLAFLLIIARGNDDQSPNPTWFRTLALASRVSFFLFK